MRLRTWDFINVDNLPVDLLLELAKHWLSVMLPLPQSVLTYVLPESPEIFEKALESLPAEYSPQLLFLDADRNTLIRRYSDTRRLHLFSTKTLARNGD